MAIFIKINEMMKLRKVSNGDLARAVGMTETNLSLLRNQKVLGFRLARLDAICRHLDCQPGDILIYAPDIWPDENALSRRTSDENL